MLCYARYKCIVTWMECFHTHFKCCTNFKSLVYSVSNTDQPKTAPQNHCKITCIHSDLVLSCSLITTTKIMQLKHIFKISLQLTFLYRIDYSSGLKFYSPQEPPFVGGGPKTYLWQQTTALNHVRPCARYVGKVTYQPPIKLVRETSTRINTPRGRARFGVE